MSWYFYLNCIVFALLTIIGICIFRSKNISPDEKIFPLIFACIVIVFPAIAIGFAIRCHTIAGSSSEQIVLDNSDSTRSMIFVVKARTMLLDGIHEYVLKPGERKMLSWFRGSMSVIDTKVVENKANSKKTATDKEDLVKRYDELVNGKTSKVKPVSERVKTTNQLALEKANQQLPRNIEPKFHADPFEHASAILKARAKFQEKIFNEISAQMSAQANELFRYRYYCCFINHIHRLHYQQHYRNAEWYVEF